MINFFESFGIVVPYRKMVPIFAPSFAHHHFPTRQHGIRATISAPIRAVHHKGRGGGERQFLHHPKLKERQSSDVASGSLSI